MERGFAGLFGKRAADLLAICWPVRNEYDARALAGRLRSAGARIALPVIVAPDEPLIFRQWNGEESKLARGPLAIAYPAAGPPVEPTAVLLPMVGFDRQAYRLGYGGGYFDRTLASMSRRPVVIGVAHELARLDTLYPQPHDIAMDYIVTEAGIYRLDGSELARVNTPML